MLDLKFVRENPDIVKQNIKNKFQDKKIPLVDEVIELDAKNRAAKKEADDLRANKNKIAKQIGALMGQGKKEEAEELKKQVAEQSARLSELEEQEKDLGERILKIMMTIPNIIDPSVPIGKDDSENVEIERFGEPGDPSPPAPTTSTRKRRLNWRSGWSWEMKMPENVWRRRICAWLSALRSAMSAEVCSSLT